MALWPCGPAPRRLVVGVFKLDSRDVAYRRAPDSLDRNVVQSEDAVQPEREALWAEDISLDDAAPDGKRFGTDHLAAR